MDFKSEKPIYRQIVEQVCDRIASGSWPEADRVPSVRDLAAQLQVNPNTVMRAYERLQMAEIITNSRGIGYFVAEGAKQRVVELKRTEFFESTLPEVFATMETLGISWEEVQRKYEER
ncbi:MAG: GntR family transcriptional regulator [Rikenella sp.]|nr:GntR family transcriptional regulator [Rikenella sp.]